MLAIYARLSKEDEDSNSIDNQLREGREFASKHNLEYEVYNEGEGISGGLDIEFRPQFKRLLDDMQSGKISAVWARAQVRIERNTYTFSQFLKIVFENNISVYFGDKKAELDTPEGRAMANIFSSFNSYVREKQAALTRKALKDNIREGKLHGVYPYGYTSDDAGKMIIHEQEAEIVRKIYAWSLSGLGQRSIINRLNEQGIPTRYNKIGKGTITHVNKHTGRKTTTRKKDILWAGNTVYGILRNPVYKGCRTFSGIEYPCPAIFTEEYWNKVQENIPKNRNNSGKKVTHRYLLKGLLTCGVCGRNYYGRINKNDNFYMCSSRRIKGNSCGNRGINITHLEDIIWLNLFGEEIIRDRIAEYFKNSDTEAIYKRLEDELQALEGELLDIDKQRNRAIKLALKGLISDKELEVNTKYISSQKKELEDKIINVKEQMKSYNDSYNNSSEYIDNLTGLNTEISFNDKYVFIRKFIKNIEVDFYEEIGLYFLRIQYTIAGMEPDIFSVSRDYKSIFTLGTDKEELLEYKFILLDADMLKNTGRDTVKFYPQAKEFYLRKKGIT